MTERTFEDKIKIPVILDYKDGGDHVWIKFPKVKFENFEFFKIPIYKLDQQRLHLLNNGIPLELRYEPRTAKNNGTKFADGHSSEHYTHYKAREKDGISLEDVIKLNQSGTYYKWRDSDRTPDYKPEIIKAEKKEEPTRTASDDDPDFDDDIPF